MNKYKGIKLTDTERELLNVLLKSNYTVINKDDMFGLFATGTHNYETKCLALDGLSYLKWMKENESYDISELLEHAGKPETVWELEYGNNYWFVGSCGELQTRHWDEIDIDHERRDQGNVFLTIEEARFEAIRRYVVASVRKYTRPFIPGKNNYFAGYDYEHEFVTKHFAIKVQYGVLYFDSIEDINKAIAEVGEDDFKKYYLEVTEHEDTIKGHPDPVGEPGEPAMKGEWTI